MDLVLLKCVRVVADHPLRDHGDRAVGKVQHPARDAAEEDADAIASARADDELVGAVFRRHAAERARRLALVNGPLPVDGGEADLVRGEPIEAAAASSAASSRNSP